MKAKTYQINALKPQIQTTYKAALLYGPDFSVVEDCANQIIEILLPKIDDFSLIKMNRSKLKEAPGVLVDEGNESSFLSERKVIWLKDADNSVTDAVETYVTDIKTDTFLLLTADNLLKNASLKILAENASDILCIACYADEIRDTQALIQSFLKENGYTISTAAMAFLLERLNENRLTTKSELEKLIIYMGETKTINEKDVEAIIPDTANTSVDRLCFSVASGDQKDADKALQILLSSGETAVGITRILMSYFNKLLLGVTLLEARTPMEDVLKKVLRANQFKQKPIMTQQLNTWKKEPLVKVLQLLLDTEKQTKTTGIPAELILERTVTLITSLPKKLRR